MRLSEAIMLGDVLRKRTHQLFLATDKDGLHCGCALGGAALALGLEITYGLWFERMLPQLETLYPWLTPRLHECIGEEFSRACLNLQTFEQFLDYVRSIEPDDEPAKAPAEVTELEHVSRT